VDPVGQRELHVVLPGDIDVPTGGNIYDRRVLEGLAVAHGWWVRRADVPGSWPLADDAARAGLVRALDAVPDGGLVLIDGIVGCAAPEVVEPATRRLRVVVLVHLPLPDETGLDSGVAHELARREGRTLRAAAAVVVTSPWAARRVASYGLTDRRVHVAPPGTDTAPLARGTGTGAGLVCVGAVAPRKDQLTLVEALARVAELPWTCVCAGPLDRAPGYVAEVRARIASCGLENRVRLVGPLGGRGLAAAYDAADLLVHPARTETFGMVVTEALARGLPVLGTTGGAVGETLGRAPDGSVPGLLVPPGDAGALSAALRRWLTEPTLRAGLVRSARARRGTLGTWDQTTQRLSAVLQELPAPPRLCAPPDAS
jgi:glycosyltransferase involved in cell wall biosynthesis